MKTVLFVFLITLTTFVGDLYSQKAESARLAGTWSGGEDPSEFIYHKVEEFALHFLPDNPGGKIVAKVCSTGSMSEALAKSSRVVKALPFQASSTRFRIPAQKVLFARSSKCKHGDQYWYVPGSLDIEHDELVSSERVRIWSTPAYIENTDSAEGRKAFLEYLREFLTEIKSDSQSKGFVFPNRRYQIRALRKQLKAEGIENGRVQILQERPRDTYHPVLVTIAIN